MTDTIPQTDAVPADEATVVRMEREYREAHGSQYHDLYARFNYLAKAYESPTELSQVSKRLDYIESQYIELDGTLIFAPQFAPTTDSISL